VLSTCGQQQTPSATIQPPLPLPLGVTPKHSNAQQEAPFGSSAASCASCLLMLQVGVVPAGCNGTQALWEHLTAELGRGNCQQRCDMLQAAGLQVHVL
jgi:hypothetical protein